MVSAYYHKQTGEFREFVSSDLTPGSTYTYVFRTQWEDGGLKFDFTRKLRVQGGEVRNVDFFSPPPE